jgi:hypothetical protein
VGTFAFFGYNTADVSGLGLGVATIRAVASQNWGPDAWGTKLEIRTRANNEQGISTKITLNGVSELLGIFTGDGVNQPSSKIQVVDAMPGTPDANTLYFVKAAP